MSDARARLEQLIRERGEDYSSLSRLLGRNPAYVQQFIRRGVPRRLGEEDRRLLARYFRIDEAELGGPSGAGKIASTDRLIAVPMLAVAAAAGSGALEGDERSVAAIGFDSRWLKAISANLTSLSTIQVSGDSMVPTLAEGDQILVDRSDGIDRLRDGIYVLRFDDALNVKRIAINPVGRRFSVRSDNPAYPEWPDCDPALIDIIGRVIWVGRRLN